jgi:hypothetical protein
MPRHVVTRKMYDMLFERACEGLLEPSDRYDSLQMREGGIPDDLTAFYSTAPGRPMRMDSRDKEIALTNAIECGNLAVVAVMLDRGVSLMPPHVPIADSKGWVIFYSVIYMFEL